MRRKVILGFGILSVVFASLTYHNTNAFSNLRTVTYPYYAFQEDSESPWESVWDALDATGTVEYSDEFFDEDSYGVHPELRAASYALALAGFENQADGYPAISVNHKLYTMLNELGFSEPESWDTASEPNGHSMGTTVAYKTLSNGQNLVVVVPRSYNYMTEWLSNFNVGTVGDHAGFSESAGLVTGRVEQYITSHDLKNNKIWIVGYSRGGAVADLVAKEINQNLATYNVSAEDLYAYTFGAPKASMVETKYTNIHDVKDGNDLLLGYLFPTQWGFYNTGVIEEIHEADLEILTYAVNIEDLTDASKIANVISGESELTLDIGTRNAKDFMDDWLGYITTHGMTREYFDSEIRPPLSAIMQVLQLRTVDRQSEVTDFIKDSDRGMLAMMYGNLLIDFMMNTEGDTMEEKLANYMPYQYLVNVLKGTATTDEISSLVNTLKNYIGEYDDYEERLGQAPLVTREEFEVIKENMPKLVEAIGPLLVEDAKHTRETYGENASLYFGYTLVSNFNALVYGHTPESIMPILKDAIPPAPIPKVPDTGASTVSGQGVEASPIVASIVCGSVVSIVAFFALRRKV